MPSALPQSQPSLPHAPSILRPAPGSAREAQSESLSPFNRPNSNLAPARAHERPESEDLGKKSNRTPLQPPASGGEAHKPGRVDPQPGPCPGVTGAPAPLEPPVTHCASRVRGRRLGQARTPGPRAPGHVSRSPPGRRLPAASARPPAAESAALRATPRRGQGEGTRRRPPAARSGGPRPRVPGRAPSCGRPCAPGGFQRLLQRDFIYLFMRDTHTHRERGRDAGRGRSRLHAGSPTWDSIPEPQDHAPSRREMLNG
uniref:translation initiation factor IF-2-like isoform X1 n=1 Tax=Nyctereutes procyonoides TaxID=34880 RepID=UPI002444CEB8|nr:translation initiation factor IF-2-like isoform X1 [Nyctereutes procyonoides]